VWDEARDAEPWHGPPTWFHGDLTEGNLIVPDGRLSGVLGRGPFARATPACELASAWLLFDPASCEVCRTAVGGDDATSRRGRGWNVSVAALAIPCCRDSVPAFAQRGGRLIAAVLSERS